MILKLEDELKSKMIGVQFSRLNRATIGGSTQKRTLKVVICSRWSATFPPHVEPSVKITVDWKRRRQLKEKFFSPSVLITLALFLTQ